MPWLVCNWPLLEPAPVVEISHWGGAQPKLQAQLPPRAPGQPLSASNVQISGLPHCDPYSLFHESVVRPRHILLAEIASQAARSCSSTLTSRSLPRGHVENNTHRFPPDVFHSVARPTESVR